MIHPHFQEGRPIARRNGMPRRWQFDGGMSMVQPHGECLFEILTSTGTNTTQIYTYDPWP